MSLFTVRKLYKIAMHNPQKISELKFSPQEMEEGLHFWRMMLDQSFADIKDDISDIPFDPETKDKCLELLAKRESELSFLMLVYAPCRLLYQTSSVKLYKKAESGDVEALVKLLSIDPFLHCTIHQLVKQYRARQ